MKRVKEGNEVNIIYRSSTGVSAGTRAVTPLWTLSEPTGEAPLVIAFVIRLERHTRRIASIHFPYCTVTMAIGWEREREQKQRLHF